MPELSRLLVAAVAVLVILDIIGGLVAISSDLNTAGGAWGAEARLAVPWFVVLVQIGLAALLVVGQRFAVAAGVVLTLMCAASVLSGLFDGDFPAAGQGVGTKAFQILLIAWMALVGTLAGLRTRELRRTRPAAATR